MTQFFELGFKLCSTKNRAYDIPRSRRTYHRLDKMRTFKEHPKEGREIESLREKCSFMEKVKRMHFYTH